MKTERLNLRISKDTKEKLDAYCKVEGTSITETLERVFNEVPDYTDNQSKILKDSKQFFVELLDRIDSWSARGDSPSNEDPGNILVLRSRVRNILDTDIFDSL